MSVRGSIPALLARVAILSFAAAAPMFAGAAPGNGGRTFLSAAPAPGSAAEGYPKPMIFRANSPELIPELGWTRMLVSDMHTYRRKFSEELFKQQFPERPALVQINCEGLGLWGSWESVPRQRFEDLGLLDPALAVKAPFLEILTNGIYPLPDFLGYWIYDAGTAALSAIPAGQETVTVRVGDAAPFRPNDFIVTVRDLKARVGQDSYMKEVVICPPAAGGGRGGGRDWLNAELATVTAIDEKAGEITLRRWRTSRPWAAHPAGAYLAPHSVLTYCYSPLHTMDLTAGSTDTKYLQPYLPNLTRYCPRDPRTGLNAAEWLARHYAQVKRTHYPSVEGYVFDVSVGTYYPSFRVSDRVDCDNDGVADNFLFDGVNHWPAGIYDFLRLLRAGRPGVFEGLGADAIIASDSNGNDDQRFFDLVNGGEYEHSMLFSNSFNATMFSSRLDRFLLWAERGRRPDVTFIHNKYPDEAYHGGDAALLKAPMTLHAYRLDMATACMGSGYVGKAVSRVTGAAPETLTEYPGKKEQSRKFGAPLPLDYDEYHAGTENVYGWLGQPTGPAARVTAQLGPAVYRFDRQAPLPTILSSDAPWEAGPVERVGEGGLRLTVRRVGLWRTHEDWFRLRAELPLPGVRFRRNGEYALRFRARGAGPLAPLGADYAGVPRSITVRLAVEGETGAHPRNGNVGFVQEALVFAQERECQLTLIAPADGAGVLQICLSESLGDVELSDIELRAGCADVLCRPFDNGLVVLNGSSFQTVSVPLAQLFPGARFRRLKGAQDPAHNNGELVGDTLDVPRQDAFFLARAK